jgi:hypothetical protein
MTTMLNAMGKFPYFQHLQSLTYFFSPIMQLNQTFPSSYLYILFFSPSHFLGSSQIPPFAYSSLGHSTSALLNPNSPSRQLLYNIHLQTFAFIKSFFFRFGTSWLTFVFITL